MSSGGSNSQRDPYPFPKLEGDVQFRGEEPRNLRHHRTSTSQAQSTDPWNRLFTTPTLASSRREIYHHDLEAPNDCLDFELKSLYDHHNEMQRTCRQVLLQTETNGNTGGRILKNRKPQPPVERSTSDGFENKVLKIIDPIKREVYDYVETQKDINNHDGAIPPHHNAATNRGYSRKHDGGFYLI